jgi:predicted membrane channel-forming protein YqfA (hemolysin III family)
VGSYRPEQSFRDSIKTLFVLHNETGNVWTHILGAYCMQQHAALSKQLRRKDSNRVACLCCLGALDASNADAAAGCKP